MPSLKYTEWVVRESMRLYPPAWGIAREALADCEIGGYHVPKGTQLFLTQWLVHRDGRWFDDPEVFRPERWDNDLIKRLPRCAYFPFGDGPRICIGNHFAMMEAVLILATIARRYRLSVEPGQTLELLPSITLRPRHGLRMRIARETEPRGRPPRRTADEAATESIGIVSRAMPQRVAIEHGPRPGDVGRAEGRRGLVEHVSSPINRATVP